MPNFVGEIITEDDKEELTLAAYKMQEVYRVPKKTMYDAMHEVHDEFPKIMFWQLQGMWCAIDAYVDINVM